MTKIVGDPECPICRRPSDRETAFFPEHKDGLAVDPVRSMFHSPAFHWDCYLSWDRRKHFAATLFDRLVADLRRSTLHGCLRSQQDLAMFVSVYEPFAITLLLRETGSKLAISIDDWTEHVSSCPAVLRKCHPVERKLLQSFVSAIWQTFPDAESIAASTDWSGTERHLYG